MRYPFWKGRNRSTGQRNSGYDEKLPIYRYVRIYWHRRLRGIGAAGEQKMVG